MPFSMPLFSVTPVLRRGFKKEWWCASAPARPRWRQPPRSGARREPGKEPATRLPTGYRPAFPGERWARVGCRQRAYGYPPAAGAGGAGAAGRSAWASSYRGATGAGEAGRSAWASSYRGAAGAGAAGRSVWISFAAGAGGVGAAGRKTPTPPVLPRRRAPPRPR